MMEADEARASRRAAFLAAHGLAAARIEALPADASFRRYFRLWPEHRFRDQAQLLLMDAPPGKDMHDADRFVMIARHLTALGLNAPEVLAGDEAEGFLLIRDFGDDTFAALLERGSDPVPLYEVAVDVLARLHTDERAIQIALDAPGATSFVSEPGLMADWFLPAITGAPCDAGMRQAWEDAWRAVFSRLPDHMRTLVLRDYHVGNLMQIAGRTVAHDGIDAVGLLDFQDGYIGHPSYDLVSLLEDARRDMAPDLRAQLMKRYQARVPGAHSDAFAMWYAVTAARRHARVAGIFVRLAVRDGKPRYLQHLPRLAGYIDHASRHEALAPVRSWLDQAFGTGPLPRIETLDSQGLRAMLQAERPDMFKV